MKQSKAETMKCPICGKELSPLEKDGRKIYYCACQGMSKPVIEILPEGLEKGVEDDSTN